MIRSEFLMVIGLGSFLVSNVAFSDEIVIKYDVNFVRTDRYTLVSMETKPEQLAPLLAVVNIRFSDDVKTIGDAILELLAGSGYRWDMAAPENTRLMELPLPLVSREIGPVRLRDALNTLVGQSWELKINELTRTVTFSVVSEEL